MDIQTILKSKEEQAQIQKEIFSPAPERFVHKVKTGLSREVVEEISWTKSEPPWMRKKRLWAYEYFLKKPMPTWGVDLSELDLSKINFYQRTEPAKYKSWKEVPADIKEKFEKIGVPQAERELLAGVVGQYDSEGFYQSLKKQWEKRGVIFCDTDTAVQKYPELVKEYFMTRCVPFADHKFAALHGAVWSGGSFLYVPPGVKVDLPMQTYFRMNARNSGQFEHTLIIVEEGASVHYIEGCFTAGTRISCNPEYKTIENVKIGDNVLTHKGRYKKVYQLLRREYAGDLFLIKYYGDPTQKLQVTAEHPLYAVKRQRWNERNRTWSPQWYRPGQLEKGDYLTIPVITQTKIHNSISFPLIYRGTKTRVRLPADKNFFRLAGYFLSEGSVNKYYLSFAFSVKEKEYIQDVIALLKQTCGVKKTYQPIHKKNNGISIVVSSSKLARVFSCFGLSSATKQIPQWMMTEAKEKQEELIKSLFFGDGNYYNQLTKHGRKEIFRINTCSEKLAYQVRDILLRLGVFAAVNKQKRLKPKQDMYVVAVGGDYAKKFGKIVGVKVREKLNSKKRASMFYVNQRYAYIPIRSINKLYVSKLPVFNFSVKDDESYTANSLTAHNCTAPIYNTDSLHSAVVEIFVKRGARCRYTTVQNWSKDVYNLNTKRSLVEEEGIQEWVGGSLGSKKTMLYPCSMLIGRGARADHLNIAIAGPGQHKDTGAKVIHGAPYTSSNIVSKSISFGGGISTYRGLLKIVKGAYGAKSHVQCDALMPDNISVSNTIPYIKIYEDDVTLGHEAKIGRISEDQVFYLMTRGLSEQQAINLIVQGFMEPVVKELPLEYAVELNRLIQLEMAGSVG